MERTKFQPKMLLVRQVINKTSSILSDLFDVIGYVNTKFNTGTERGLKYKN